MRHTAKLTLGADSKQPYSLLPLLTLMMTFSSGSIMRLWRLSFSLLFFRFPFPARSTPQLAPDETTLAPRH